MTNDTLSELIFAISGRALEYGTTDPFHSQAVVGAHAQTPDVFKFTDSSRASLPVPMEAIALPDQQIGASGTILPRNAPIIYSIAA